MDDKLIAEAYNLIQKTIDNPKSVNRRVADEIFDKCGVSREDLAQEVFIKFIEKENHPEIKKLSSYINKFAWFQLQNLKRYYERRRACSLDELMEDGLDIADV